MFLRLFLPPQSHCPNNIPSIQHTYQPTEQKKYSIFKIRTMEKFLNQDFPFAQLELALSSPALEIQHLHNFSYLGLEHAPKFIYLYIFPSTKFQPFEECTISVCLCNPSLGNLSRDYRDDPGILKSIYQLTETES